MFSRKDSFQFSYEFASNKHFETRPHSSFCLPKLEISESTLVFYFRGTHPAISHLIQPIELLAINDFEEKLFSNRSRVQSQSDRSTLKGTGMIAPVKQEKCWGLGAAPPPTAFLQMTPAAVMVESWSTLASADIQTVAESF